MLPDISNDAVVRAARNLGVQFTETFFYRVCLEAGFGRRAEDEARKWDLVWRRQGFDKLPLWIRNRANQLASNERYDFSNVPIKKIGA